MKSIITTKRVAKKKKAAVAVADAVRNKDESLCTSMKFEIKAIQENAGTLLRRAGYTFQYEKDGEMSFVRPLASAGYPRFHLYAKVSGIDLHISFHLDQKAHTYGEETRHHGEYENEGILKEEADHLKKVLSTNGPVQDFSL